MSKISINVAPLGIPPIYREGELIPVQDIKIEGNDMISYILPDGTTIKLKNVLLQVVKIDDIKDMNGNPIYNIQTQNIIQVDSPTTVKNNE